MSSAYKVVAIGGSAGSFQVVGRILQGLPRGFSLPLLLCLHRLKHVRSGFVEALSQVARTYRDKAVGIVLSGANRDGAAGLSYLKRLGGVALVQSLSECEVRTMPEAAKECTNLDGELRTEELVEYLKSLC